MASILTVQALLFADGGLLTLGCNIINLGFFPCFIAYPLIYRKLAGEGSPTPLRRNIAVTVATVIGLQLGAFGVVVETLCSGISELPFQTFTLFMLPVHLVIGLVEAAVTSAVLAYVWKEAPGLFPRSTAMAASHSSSMRKVLLTMVVAALLTAGVLSWFASNNPDGLEWAVQKTSGQEEIENSSPVHAILSAWQEKIAPFPDYQVAALGSGDGKNGGTSAAGIVGASMTLLLAGAVGAGCRMLVKRNAQ
jgi:cobalt/nickel transport system permease protein